MTNPTKPMATAKLRRTKILKRAPFGGLSKELKDTAAAFEHLTALLPAMPGLFGDEASREIVQKVTKVNEDINAASGKIDTMTAALRKLYGHEIKPILVEFDAKDVGAIDWVERDELFVNLVGRAVDIGDVVGMARLVIIIARLRADLNSRRSKLTKLAYRVTHSPKDEENDSAAMAEEKMKVVCEVLEKRIKLCGDKFLELHATQKNRLDQLMSRYKSALIAD